MENLGNIALQYERLEQKNALSPKVSFTPEQGLVPEKEQQVIAGVVLSDVLGHFQSVFHWEIKV